MLVEAVTEQFPVTSAQLATDQAGMAAGSACAAPALAPIPAGLDEVSAIASSMFTEFGALVLAAIADAGVKQECGDAALAVAGAAYRATDVAGGAMVAAHPVSV
ncbi:PE domain-containing protein [Nocardia sp. NPDC051832]|uniref:PE domain-containing protein n=1 Tax=Nocardia sp. NPDC051832 TaxID=3155673 RepID=UPI003440A569